MLLHRLSRKWMLFVGMLVAVMPCVSSARDGQLGTTSTGYVEISLTIPELIKIANTHDIDLGSYTGEGPMKGNEDLCIYSNVSGGYKVSISDNGPKSGGTFMLHNTKKGQKNLSFHVSWNNTSGVSGSSEVLNNKQLSFGKVRRVNCYENKNNANISVDIPKKSLENAPPGLYKTRLAILIEPL